MAMFAYHMWRIEDNIPDARCGETDSLCRRRSITRTLDVPGGPGIIILRELVK